MTLGVPHRVRVVLAAAALGATLVGCGAAAPDPPQLGVAPSSPVVTTTGPPIAAPTSGPPAAAPTSTPAPPPTTAATLPVVGDAGSRRVDVAGPPAPPSTGLPDADAPVRSGANVNQRSDVGDPQRVIVASVGIDGPVAPAGVLDDGTVAVPLDPSIAGWFTGGPRPGEIGPAVIVGHVDSKRFGPGVFWRLDEVQVGATVTVQTTTQTATFVVTATERIPKTEFPTDRVYGPVPDASLRLITCGGSFDRSTGHYRDNVVVYLERIAG